MGRLEACDKLSLSASALILGFRLPIHIMIVVTYAGHHQDADL